MFSFNTSPRGASSLLPVLSPQQLGHYLRESEMITGAARRLFVIASADRLRYQVQWTPQGCQVERLDAQGNPLNTTVLDGDGLIAHPLFEALRSGQLFTPPAHH